MDVSRLLLFVALVAVLGAVAFAAIDLAPRSEPTEPEMTEAGVNTEPEREELPVLRAAPELVEIDGWLQTDATSLDDFKGRVIVLQFWTFACRNCKATIPNLQVIYESYSRSEVEIVGVHAPEFSFEAEPEAIQAAANELGVSWPIALDTQKRNFHSWQIGKTAYWPRTYVIDSSGNIRFDHIGEGRYEELRNAVASLVAES